MVQQFKAHLFVMCSDQIHLKNIPSNLLPNRYVFEA